MKAYRKEIIIIIIQVFMHCIFPVFAGPGDEMGLVVLLLLSTFVLSFLMGCFSRNKLKFTYPIVPALLFVLTIPIYYNASALIHAVWYLVLSALGVLTGLLMLLLKKLTFKTWIIVGIVILILGFSISFGRKENDLDKYSEEVGINISWGDVISEGDSHGGFHGDGTGVMVVHYTDSSLEPEIQESDKWNSFPLPEELEKVVYGKTEGNVTTVPYIVDAFDDMRIPEITKGYYYFKDRHSESTEPYDSSSILERHSFNFTILLYDCDTDLLYIIEEDT